MQDKVLKRTVIAILFPVLSLIFTVRYLDLPSCEFTSIGCLLVGGLLFVYILVTLFFFFSSLVSIFVYKDKRERMLVRLLYTISSIFLTVLSFKLSSLAGDFAIQGAIDRGQILIEALTKYKSDRGFYPESLKKLLPSYLESIPQTRHCSFKTFSYSTSSDFKSYSLQARFGLYGWDGLVYESTGRYEMVTKRYGKWSYYVD